MGGTTPAFDISQITNLIYSLLPLLIVMILIPTLMRAFSGAFAE